jgi:hypothetical protein
MVARSVSVMTPMGWEVRLTPSLSTVPRRIDIQNGCTENVRLLALQGFSAEYAN